MHCLVMSAIDPERINRHLAPIWLAPCLLSLPEPAARLAALGPSECGSANVPCLHFHEVIGTSFEV